MVLLQFLGGSFLRSDQIRQNNDEQVSSLISDYYALVFDLNIIFALVFIINFIARKYLIINDTNIYYVPKLHIQVLSQYTVDILLIVISVIYIYLGIDILISVSTLI